MTEENQSGSAQDVKLEEAPDQRWRLLRAILPKPLQPILRGFRLRMKGRKLNLEEPYRTVFAYTQVHPVRQHNLVRLAGDIEQNNIPGVVVECGVLDGGGAALMAHGTKTSGREVHLFDAWQGLPTTTDKDGAKSRRWEGQVVGSKARVARVMKRLNIAPERIVYHVGWFNDTFPTAGIDTIALLHIDADFYEGVKLCLDTWYPKLSSGGWIQIDDYQSFQGARAAVDEFLAVNPGVRLESTGEHARAFFFKKP